MQGAKDLIDSERGWFCLFVVVIAFVLTLVGRVTGTEWLSFVKWVAIALVAGKTASGFVGADGATPPPTAST